MHGPSSALSLHQHINQKSHMIKIEYYDWYAIVLSNGMFKFITLQKIEDSKFSTA